MAQNPFLTGLLGGLGKLTKTPLPREGYPRGEGVPTVAQSIFYPQQVSYLNDLAMQGEAARISGSSAMARQQLAGQQTLEQMAEADKYARALAQLNSALNIEATQKQERLKTKLSLKELEKKSKLEKKEVNDAAKTLFDPESSPASKEAARVRLFKSGWTPPSNINIPMGSSTIIRNEDGSVMVVTSEAVSDQMGGFLPYPSHSLKQFDSMKEASDFMAKVGKQAEEQKQEVASKKAKIQQQMMEAQAERETIPNYGIQQNQLPIVEFLRGLGNLNLGEAPQTMEGARQRHLQELNKRINQPTYVP